MAQLLVRDLDEKLVQKLKRRAAENGVSCEEEHRRILRDVLTQKGPKPSFKEHLLAMPDVGEDWMFDRNDPRVKRPESRPVSFED